MWLVVGVFVDVGYMCIVYFVGLVDWLEVEFCVDGFVVEFVVCGLMLGFVIVGDWLVGFGYVVVDVVCDVGVIVVFVVND